jgi:hypothetical protein
LFIAGDKERLRDEIVYAAHRAGNPKKYKLSEGLIKRKKDPREEEWDEKKTETHLQIYDGGCHDFGE